MPRLILVVPCYDEEARLAPDAFRDFLAVEADAHLLFVDDGSRDATPRLLESIRSDDPGRVRILRLPRNQGKAEAVRRGVLEALSASPAYVGYWDADLATPLAAVRAFRELLDARDELEVVFGARVKLLGRSIDRRALRHYLGRVAATSISALLDLAVYDTQCGAKLFRASPDLEKLFSEPFRTGWIFDVEILARLIAARHATDRPQAEQVVYEYPLEVWRDVPGSKIGPVSYLRAARDLVRLYRDYPLCRIGLRPRR